MQTPCRLHSLEVLFQCACRQHDHNDNVGSRAGISSDSNILAEGTRRFPKVKHTNPQTFGARNAPEFLSAARRINDLLLILLRSSV